MAERIPFLRKAIYIGTGALLLIAVGLPSTTNRLGLMAGVVYGSVALLCFWHGTRLGRIAAVLLVVLGVVLLKVFA